MAKIVFKNDKPHIRIGNKSIPVAESITVPAELNGEAVTGEESAYINGNAVIKKFIINGTVYSSDITSTPEEVPEQRTEDIKPKRKESSGRLIRNQQNGRYVFISDQNADYTLDWRNYPDEFQQMDGADVDAEMMDDTVTKIIYESKTYTDMYARAPYNFIPLNNKLVAGIPPPDFTRYHEGLFSGYIDLTLTTKTPIFIRGEKENFLLVNEKPVLPGSSLRGILRTLVEMVSYGKFINYQDKTLYQRKSGFNAAGRRKMGFLFYDSNSKKYTIYEAANKPIHIRTGNEFEYEFEVVNNTVFVKIYSGRMGSKNFKIEYKKGRSQYTINEKIIESYKEDDNRNAGGEMKSLIATAENLSFKNRLDQFNTGNNHNDEYKYIGIPVWYELGGINDKDEVIHFGHCKNYRIPYQYAIGHKFHIPSELQDISKTDFAESIFGTTERAGRVYFEDAYTDETNWFIEEKSKAYQPKILASPKLTTFQHYLEQKPLGKDTPSKKLKHWGDDNINIRGYKLYWHRNTNEVTNPKYKWTENEDKEITDSHPDPIKPVRDNVTFHSRIRFENLTTEELGALLFVLDLPGECCHKLGMGKPLGLGSVRIEAEKLVLIDRVQRYAKLFNDDFSAWNTGERTETDLREFKNTFAKHICIAIGEPYNETKGFLSLWESERLKQLKEMLTFNHSDTPDWLDRTRYMEIEHTDNNNEYKSRPVLPYPGEVIIKETYKK